MTDVVSVNRSRALAITDDDQIIKISLWFDEFGDECEPADAVSCVAEGLHRGRRAFFVIDLSQFESVSPN